MRPGHRSQTETQKVALLRKQEGSSGLLTVAKSRQSRPRVPGRERKTQSGGTEAPLRVARAADPEPAVLCRKPQSGG